MLNQWILSYWNWCHELGIHMYLIPSLVLLAAMLIGAGIHWRNQNKLKREGEAAEKKAAAPEANAAPSERS